jgi:hypothetical protein
MWSVTDDERARRYNEQCIEQEGKIWVECRVVASFDMVLHPVSEQLGGEENDHQPRGLH